MPVYFKIFCLGILLICQFLLLVNYINGSSNFGNLQTDLAQKIIAEKDKKTGLQSNLGQKINQEIKLNQSQGLVKRVENVQKVSEIKMKKEISSSQVSSMPINPVLTIK